jgi:hypothetical protein
MTLFFKCLSYTVMHTTKFKRKFADNILYYWSCGKICIFISLSRDGEENRKLPTIF